MPPLFIMQNRSKGMSLKNLYLLRAVAPALIKEDR